jgi:hypothetical protein
MNTKNLSVNQSLAKSDASSTGMSQRLLDNAVKISDVLVLGDLGKCWDTVLGRCFGVCFVEGFSKKGLRALVIG